MNNDNFNYKQDPNENKKSGGSRFGIFLLALFLAALTVLVINI